MKLTELVHLERKIVIGMISSTKFLKIAQNIIELKWVNSSEAKLIMEWCLDFYKKYQKAPQAEIQDIFMEKLRTTNIPKNKAQFIEEILQSLSNEYTNDGINLEYLRDQTILYSKACKLNGYAEQIQDEVQNGNILEAEAMFSNYKPPEDIQSNAVTPLGSVQQIKDAFAQSTEPLIKYPGDLGNLLNSSMTRESFVSVLAPNKTGKSFFLMDAAFRGAKKNKKVLFIQCGDMSQAQMERRQGIYLTKKSDMQMYCGTIYIPVIDCIYNQNGDCTESFREDPDAEFPFDGLDINKIKDLSRNDLIEAFEDNPDHTPCYNCKRLKNGKFKGTIWYKKREPVTPLTWKDCCHVTKKYQNVLKNIRMITYSSESLTMKKLESELEILSKTGFNADVLILDYIDLIAPDYDTKNLQTRDQENKKWQRARRMAQERKLLFLTASQSDTQGFNKLFLSRENFSDDRRKLDHVTMMMGLNMTNKEKKKGLLRINQIVSRENQGTDYVNVCHCLQIGQMILGSFY